MRDIILFIREIRGAYKLWKNDLYQFIDAQLLEGKLEEVGLDGDAAHNIGSALRLAEKLGIELHPGLAFSDCRAVLPRSKWKFDVSNKTFDFGQFTVKPYADVTEIQMLDINPCFAISRCALVAKESKVI